MVAKAYREYCAEAAQQYAMLMDAVNDTVSLCEAGDQTVQQVVDTVLQTYSSDGLTADRNIVFKSGVYSLSSVLTQIATATKNQLDNIEANTLVDIDPLLTMVDLNGDVKQRSIGDLMSEMNSNFHSIVVEKAVATAYDTGGSISEKINTVRDVIASDFNSAYTDISNCLNDSIDKMRSGFSIVDYLISRMKTSGIEAGRAQQINCFEESDDFKYTGSSPIVGISCMAIADKFISFTVNAMSAVCATVYTIMNGILNVGKKIFGTVVKKLVQVVANPYDIKAINEGIGNNTVNGFFISQTLSASDYPKLWAKLQTGPIHCDFVPCELMLQLHPASSQVNEFTNINEGFTAMAQFRGHTLNVSNGLLDGLKQIWSNGNTLYDFYNYLSYEEAVQPSDLTHLLDLMNSFRVRVLNAPQIDIMCKIKPIKYKYLISDSGHSLVGETVHQKPGLHYKYSLSLIKDRLDYMVDGADPYTSVDREEVDLYKDFVTGSFFTTGLLTLLYIEAGGTASDYMYLPHSMTDILKTGSIASVKNSDFFKLFVQDKIKGSNGTYINAYTIPSTMVLKIFENIFVYRQENPYDFQFWPYSMDNAAWFDSSFEVATDDQNANDFNEFFTKAIVVAIIATISIKFLVKLKRARWAAKVNLMGAEWKLADLASQGANTTVALKTYKKANLKNNILSNLSANLLVSGANKVASGFEKDNSVNVDLSPVINLIK